MTEQDRHRKQRAAAPEVGSIVGIRMGGKVKPARVIEDRGNIGAGGRRLVRIELPPDPEFGGEPVRFERPVERLLDAPRSS